MATEKARKNEQEYLNPSSTTQVKDVSRYFYFLPFVVVLWCERGAAMSAHPFHETPPFAGDPTVPLGSSRCHLQQDRSPVGKWQYTGNAPAASTDTSSSPESSIPGDWWRCFDDARRLGSGARIRCNAECAGRGRAFRDDDRRSSAADTDRHPKSEHAGVCHSRHGSRRLNHIQYNSESDGAVSDDDCHRGWRPGAAGHRAHVVAAAAAEPRRAVTSPESDDCLPLADWTADNHAHGPYHDRQQYGGRVAGHRKLRSRECRQSGRSAKPRRREAGGSHANSAASDATGSDSTDPDPEHNQCWTRADDTRAHSSTADGSTTYGWPNTPAGNTWNVWHVTQATGGTSDSVYQCCHPTSYIHWCVTNFDDN